MKKIAIGIAGAVVLLAGGITAFVLLRPQKADINVNLSGQTVTEADADIPFNILISRKAKSATTATLEVDGESYTGEIAVGEKNCTIMVPNPYKDDVYSGDQVVKAKVTAVTGSHIGAVDLNAAQAEVTVSEILDTTLVEISAKDAVEGDPNVEFTISLTNPVKTDATVDVDVDGSEYTVDIPAGESEALLEVKNPNENDTFYDPSTMKAVVTAFNGGDFEAVDFNDASVVADIFDSVDATTVTLTTADNREGAASILFTVSLSNEAKKDAEITVNVGGTDYKVKIPANSKSAVLEVENPNKEDPYIDASTLEGKVTNVTGGGFESIDFSKATATARISDTTDITRATLIADDTEEGVENAIFTVSLSAKAQTKVTASLEVEGKPYSVTIPAGQDSATVSIKNSNSDDPYSDATKLTGKLTQVSGGNFEYLVISKDEVVLNINDTVDSTVVSINADDIVEGAEDIIFTISLSNVPVTKTAMTVNVSGTPYEVTIPAGSTSTTLTVANTNSEDYYKDASSITAKVSEFTGGLFEDVDLSNASETVYIADTINTTKMTLSAADIHEGDADIVYSVKLSNKAQTDVDVTLKAGGVEYPATIEAGSSSVNISVPNTNADDVYADASTLYGEITAFDGGNFEKLDISDANTTANILDTVNTTNVSLATSDVSEGTANINFTVTLSNPAKTAAEITVDIDGQNQKATVAAGSTTANITIENTNAEDVYVDASKVIGTVTAVNGGSFEEVDFSTATATANVSDTTDITSVSLTADDTDEAAEKVIYTATLTNAAQTDVTVTVTANGSTFTGTIGAGQTSGTIEVTNPNKEDALLDASTLEGVVTDVTGGNFEQIDFSSAKATASIADTTDTTTVTLSADDIEEGNANVVFNVELSNAAGTETTVTVTVNGVGHNAVIAAGEKTGSVSVSHTNTEDVYVDKSSMTGTVTAVNGGNFEDVDYSSATATADINDTIDTTTVTITAGNITEGTSDIGFTVTFDNPAETATTITVDVDGTEYKPVMSANTSSVSFAATNSNTEDAYLDASTVTGKVTAVDGGNFESVDFSEASTTVNVTDTIDNTGITLTAPADTNEGDALVFDVTLTNAPKNTPATVTLDVDGKTFTGTVAVDATTGTVTVDNPYSDDAYVQGSRKVTATVTDVTGGNFESVNFSGVSADATVNDTTTDTTLTLTAPDPTEEGSALIFEVELSAAAETETTVSLAVGGNIFPGTIEAGKTTGTVTVDNPYLDDAYVQDNRTVTATVYNVTGGNFENVDYSGVSADATVIDSKTTATNVTLTAPAPTDEGDDLVFAVELDTVPTSDVTVTLDVDGDTFNGTINANDTKGTVTVTNPHSDDAYVQTDRTVTATVDSVEGGNFEYVDINGVSADATVQDNNTATTITLTAPEPTNEGDDLIFTVELDTVPTSDVTVTLDVDGDTFNGTINANDTKGTVTVTNPHSDDAYVQTDRTVTATVDSVVGGNFENINKDNASAEATVIDLQTETVVTLTAADSVEEGEDITYTVEFSNKAETATTVVLDINGSKENVSISANSTSGSVTVSNPFSDDAYDNGPRDVVATVDSIDGGNFEHVDKTAATYTTEVTDNATVTTVSVSGPDSDVDEGVDFDITVSVNNAAQSEAIGTVTIDSQNYDFVIPAGSSSTEVTITNPNTEDAILDSGSLTVEVTDLTNGSYEAVDCSSATTTVEIKDTLDDTTATLSTSDIYEGDPSATFTVTLSCAAPADMEFPIKVEDDTYRIVIDEGKTSGSVDVYNPKSNDVYSNNSFSISASIDTANITGGDQFENLVCSPDSVSAAVKDVVDTTTVTLSIKDYKATDEKIKYIVTLSSPAQTDCLGNIYINDETIGFTVVAGTSSVTVEVDNIPENRTARLSGVIMGGNFEYPKAETSAITAKETTIVSITGSDIFEDDDAEFTVSLSSAATANTTVTVDVTSDAGYSNTFTVTIPTGDSTATLNFTYANNVYKDSKMKAVVTKVEDGSGTAWDIASASVEITVTDSTLEGTTVSARYSSASNVGGVKTYYYIVTLTNPALNDTDVYIKIGNEEPCKVTVKAGDVTADYIFIGNLENTSVEVTSVGTNDFENVAY